MLVFLCYFTKEWIVHNSTLKVYDPYPATDYFHFYGKTSGLSQKPQQSYADTSVNATFLAERTDLHTCHSLQTDKNEVLALWKQLAVDHIS